MTKVKLHINILSLIYPEARMLPYLPRKKKKKLKKDISNKLSSLLLDEVVKIINDGKNKNETND